MHHWIRNAFVGLMTAFMLIVDVANALAAERAVLGNVAQIPLAASDAPDAVRTFNLLRKQAEKKGTMRIIVGVRAAFAPEGTMDADSVAKQRREIAQAQSAVLEKVPSLKQRPEGIKRFYNIPFMSLEVNATELEALASLTEIISIEEDRLAAPTLGDAVAVPESK